jgi:hypothetical protein
LARAFSHWDFEEVNLQNLEPTPEQQEQAKRVQEAVARELELLAAEGVDPTLLIAGTSAAMTDLVRRAYGPQCVAPLLMRQARLAEQLGWNKA